MMLCKADFEDLFPDLFPPEPATIAKKKEELDESISRPESAVMPGFRQGWPGVMMIGAELASASIVAAHHTIWRAPRAGESR